jgi:hypothetical protein
MDRLRTVLAGRAAPLVVGLALGLLYAAIEIGPRPLNPTNTTWIFGDTATYYSGWEEYRHDPHLHFPLSWTERIGYPFGTSIARLDSIPLAAFLLRPLSPLLPEPFQYLGLWMVLSLVLQAYFAFSLCRRLFGADSLFALIASLFLFVSPPLVYRLCEHIALTSHWLILAAIDAYFRDPSGRPVRWLARGWVIAAIAAAVNPYIAAMCVIVVLGSVGRLLVERHCRWSMAAGLALATIAIVSLSGLAFGVLASTEAGAYWAPGYGAFSLNLNAPFNPVAPAFPCCTAHAPAGSLVLPSLPLAYPEQYEGYGYLGLGILALLAIHLARRPGSILWLCQRRVSPLVIAALVCTLLAISTSVTFGSHTLLDVHWPARIGRVLEGLRASGRLFWPAYYLIVVAALSLAYWTVPARYRVALISAALVVQLADLAPLHAETRGVCEARFPNLLRSSAWNDLGARFDNLIMIPAYQCGAGQAAGGMFNYVYFGKLAAIERMRTNNYYAARYTDAELRAHCVDLLRTQLEGRLDSRSAYVVSDKIRDVWQARGVPVSCQEADGNNLCAQTAGSRNLLSRAQPVPTYVFGTVLDFTQPDGPARHYETFGWRDAMPDGTWTEGPLAMLRLGQDPTGPPRALDLEVDAVALTAPRHPTLDVDVAVNDQVIARWTYDASVTRQHARIEAAVAARRPELVVEFRVRNPESPQSAGVGTDPGFLGLRVHSIVIRPGG